MMEQSNDVQEKRGSDAEHRNQDKKEVPTQSIGTRIRKNFIHSS